MNIVIPMAGKGQRIIDYFNCPKPLIKIHEKYLIELASKSIGISGNYIFITREFNEFDCDYNLLLNNLLKELFPGCQIIVTNSYTQGAVCSVLLAEHLIDNSEQLIVTNCDHILKWDHNKFIDFINKTNPDGCVTTYPHLGITLNAPSPYSFIKLKDGKAIQFKEKFAISKYSLNGVHYWKHGSYFVESAKKLILLNDTYNNEFYVSNTYNYLLDKTITRFAMKKNEFVPLGTTEEILNYLNTKSV